MSTEFTELGEEVINRNEVETCRWDRDTEYFEDDRIYSTECKQEFILNDGTPKDNSFRYCPYCGKQIKGN